MRTLLAERFQLAIRAKTKDLPVYAVALGKNGPKFPRAEIQEKNCVDDPEPTTSPVTAFLQNWTDRPVIDRTGLKGLFVIESEGWAPIIPRQEPGASGEEGLSDPARPTLFVVFDRLGLKLESRRAPVKVYNIEHVEKPAGN